MSWDDSLGQYVGSDRSVVTNMSDMVDTGRQLNMASTLDKMMTATVKMNDMRWGVGEGRHTHGLVGYREICSDGNSSSTDSDEVQHHRLSSPDNTRSREDGGTPEPTGASNADDGGRGMRQLKKENGGKTGTAKSSEKNSKHNRLSINSRERRRMHDLNDALDDLRSVIPYAHGPSVRKLSKIATLLLAKNYILMQSNALEEMRRVVSYVNQSQLHLSPPPPPPYFSGYPFPGYLSASPTEKTQVASATSSSGPPPPVVPAFPASRDSSMTTASPVLAQPIPVSKTLASTCQQFLDNTDSLRSFAN